MAFKRMIDAANTSSKDLPVHEQEIPNEPIGSQRLPEEVPIAATGNNSTDQDAPPDASGKAVNTDAGKAKDRWSTKNPSPLIYSPEKIGKFETVASTLDVKRRKEAARKILRLMAEPSMTIEQVRILLKKYRIALKKIDKANSNVLPVQQEVVLGLPAMSSHLMQKYRRAVKKKIDKTNRNVVLPVQQEIVPKEVSVNGICKAVNEFDLNMPPDEPIGPQRLPEVPSAATGKAVNDFDLNMLPDDDDRQE